MQSLSRRRFAQTLFAGAALAGTAGLAAKLRAKERAIVVGGGPAGAQAALALRAVSPRSHVLLIERDPTRLAESATETTAGPFSRPGTAIALDALRRAGVEVVLDDVGAVDWRAARLDLFSGRALAFERLLLAPGTAPRAEAIAGLDAVARHDWPAAWGNPREARRLLAQLSALPERGHVVLRLPAEISHPEVALARARDLAGLLAETRPAARLTVLDGSASDHLATAFAEAAAPDPFAMRVDWRIAGAGGTVLGVDPRRGRIETDAGLIRADVVNFVPPHSAGTIARLAGLADTSGWCPCDGHGHSSLRPEVQILGDARKDVRRTLAAALQSGRDV